MMVLAENSTVYQYWTNPTLNWFRDHRASVLQEWGLADQNQPDILPIETWVQLLHEIEAEDGNLLALGMLTAAHLLSACRIESVMRALYMLEDIYRKTYASQKAGLGYRLGAADDNTVMLTSQTPYPDDFEYGLIYGMVYACRKGNQDVQVDQFHSLPRLGNYNTRTYVIRLDIMPND